MSCPQSLSDNLWDIRYRNGANHVRDEQMIADLSHQYGVEAFIYSSAMRLGQKYEQHLKYSARAKVKIEEHVMALGEKGLGWT